MQIRIVGSPSDAKRSDVRRSDAKRSDVKRFDSFETPTWVLLQFGDLLKFKKKL